MPHHMRFGDITHLCGRKNSWLINLSKKKGGTGNRAAQTESVMYSFQARAGQESAAELNNKQSSRVRSPFDS